MSKQLALLAARIFVVTGGLFALFWALVDHSPWRALSGGVFFGLCMAVVLTLLTAARTRGRPGNLGTRQSETLIVAMDPQTVHARLTDALARRNAPITSSTPAEIRARTSISWQSWGERIDVDIQATDGGTRVDIRSHPRLRTTIADYGRNRDNIEHLLRWLDQPAAPGPPASNTVSPKNQ